MAIKSTIGITSACAEKSPFLYSSASVTRNYLRMRGEEGGLIGGIPRAMELPPHARRRALITHTSSVVSGITSACAEKRSGWRGATVTCGNYLRMRGEEDHFALSAENLQELPPHARRRVVQRALPVWLRGITSACAEKRGVVLAQADTEGNYLRMRGEECKLLGKSRSSVELPPHARRRESRPAQPNL